MCFCAAEVLGRFSTDGDRIAPALARVVSGDGDPRVREAAIHALEKLGRYDRALVNALRDPDPGVRTGAALAIERTGGCGKWEAVIALVEALDDPDARVRWHANYALLHRSDASIPTLKTRLEDPDPGVRARAAAALKRIDP